MDPVGARAAAPAAAAPKIDVDAAARQQQQRDTARAFLWTKQLYILLWKNVYLKRLCRHYLTLVLEIAFLVALLMGIQEDAVVREPLVRRADTVYEDTTAVHFWNTQKDQAHITKVYYYPENDYVRLLTTTAMKALNVSAVVGLRSEQQLLKAAGETANSSGPVASLALHYKGKFLNDTHGKPVSLHVVLYAGRLPFDVQGNYRQRLVAQPEGPSAEEHFPEMHTLLPVMGVLQRTHLQLQARRFNYSHWLDLGTAVRLRRFPFPTYIEQRDTKNYALVLTRFCIGMLIPFSVLVARVTDERATGGKEMLRLVGVNDWVYWASHYLSSLFVHLGIVALMLLIMCVKRNDEGRAFIQFSDPLLLFWILMCFHSSCVLHGLTLSMFFARPHSAVAGAMLYWTFSCVMPFLMFEQAGGQGYYYIKRKDKLMTSIFPAMSLHWSFRVLERFEKFVDHGANWVNFNDRAETPDNVTLAEIVMIGLLFDCFLAVVIWYMDNVFPLGPGIPKPFLYPFQVSYWIPSISFAEQPQMTLEEMLNFEEEPADLMTTIEIVRACKDYDGVTAVEDVSLRIFENQITVLLGHNGAGKTTLLNLITGFLGCSSGRVLVGGYDTRTSTRDARDSIGYCAQDNIFFDDMTVEEHLMFFAIVKGVPLKKARLEVVTLLHETSLYEHRSVMVMDLSLGLQRRLCAALAIVATPKVVILDEPTTNMDPDGRREMWELLLKLKRTTAVLLTTQHLDEADVLGDRIAIMANGRIRCAGSPTFLKHRFSTGYHLLITKLPKCNVPAIETLMRKFAPKARLQTNSDNEAVFVLGQILGTRLLIKMFKELEDKTTELGIESVGVTVTSLEDVLIRVGEEHHIHRHHRHPDADVKSAASRDVSKLEQSKNTAKDAKSSSTVKGPKRAETKRSTDRITTVKGSTKDQDTSMNEHLLTPSDTLVRAISSATSNEATFCARVRAIVTKRAIYTWRQKMPLFSWLLPPLLLFLLFTLENLGLSGLTSAVEHAGDAITYTFPGLIGRSEGYLQVDTEQGFIDNYLYPLLPKQYFEVQPIEPNMDVVEKLLTIAKETLYAYVFNKHFVIHMTKAGGNVLWYNGQIQHVAPLLLSLYNDARLRNVTRVDGAAFTFEVSARLSNAAAESEHIKSQNAYRELLPKVLRAIFFPLVSSLMCSNFVLFPISERALQMKHLQFLTGVSPGLYWTLNYVFDFAFYMGTALLVLLPLAILQSATLTSTDMELIFVMNLLHGYAALPLIYICSFVFDNPGYGSSVMAITFFAVSSVGFMGRVFMEHYASDLEDSPALVLVIESLLQVLRLLPTYSYSRGMTTILQLAAEKSTCQRGGSELANECHAKVAEVKMSLQRCCQHLKSPDPSEYAIHPFEVHSYSAFYDFLALTLEGAVLFVLLIYLERKLPKAEQALSALEPEHYETELASKPSRLPGFGAGHRKSVVVHDDTDVVKEDQLVASLLPGQVATSSDQERPLMVVHRLFRAYGYFESTIVLQGLSFTVRTGECFGLLGVHGVGKTTTFRIITGEILPHSGNIYVNTLSVVKDRQEFQRLLGYCPQRDGLLDMLTGIEMLMLFTRLKGIQVMPGYIDMLLEMFRLEDYADQLVGTYSAGNRRKLSLCIAVMGMPRLLLLDEPYAGVGTTARKRIVSYISSLQRVAKLSIVLTSHSLSDVEFLCNRIAILGGGRLQCLGSLVHLKEKFGKGYTITVKTYPDKKQDLTYQKEVSAAVMNYFKEAELVHTYEGLLEFRMSRTRMPWSEMFIKMARIKKKFKLQDFFVTDTSLEQIFLSVTRKEASDAAAANLHHKTTHGMGTTVGI